MIAKIHYFTRLQLSKLQYRFLSNKRNSINMIHAWDTVDYIIQNRCSISRFGDGELDMIYNYEDNSQNRKSGFQNFDHTLGKRLKEILIEGGNEEFNHKVGLPGTMFSGGTDYLLHPAKSFWQTYTVQNLNRTLKLIDKSKIHLETNFSRFYLSHRDKSRCKEFINHVKKIWKGRDLIIVEGKNTCLGVGNDLFQGAQSIKRILCPSTNAWAKYDTILNTITQTTPPMITR